MVAVVGARNASALGIKFAGRIAQDLGASGLVVVSGLARGIDYAAHKGALESGTVAVLAGGIDVIYPPENASLYEQIRAEGVLISEMALGMAPLPRHFPRRNRIILGLSRGRRRDRGRRTLRLSHNGALRAGAGTRSLRRSGLAARSPRQGGNRLIRDGATLTESADDVVSVLRPIFGHSFREPDSGPAGSAPADAAGTEAEADRVRVLVEEKLSPSPPVEIDELVRQTGAPAAAVLTVILELELAGRVQRHPGNQIAWR